MPDGRIATNTIELNPIFLMYAFRYALGRQSYSVAEVANELIAHRNDLTADWRRQIVQDVTNAIANDAAGQQCDIDRWREVARVMGE